MPLFVIFVLASVVFGAGAMLAPALPTPSPRIGLGGALALAFVLNGAIFYAALFGWSTLVIDYVWFALVVGIFLGGTLSAGMFRAEASGLNAYTGWPGPRELAFFLTVGIVFTLPALILPVPLDTDAQGFGYLALMLRSGGTLTTLAPFHPEVGYLYSPALPVLAAYLSQQLHTNLGAVQLGIGAVLSLLFVWVAYDFGNEVDPDESRRLGIAMAVCALIGTGLLTADLDSHYSALLGLTFALAFLTFVMRFHREGKRGDFLGAALTLGGVVLAQPDMTIILGLGYATWLVITGIQVIFPPRVSGRGRLPALIRWLAMAFGIPLTTLIGIGPWVIAIAPLLGGTIQSPFVIDTPPHLLVLVAYQGGIIVLLALVGIAIAVRRRRPVDLLMIVWLVLVVDFSSLGIIQAILPGLPIFKYDYPFSIAWHGPIIPYSYLGATGLLWIIDRVGRQRAVRWIRAVSLPAMTLVILMAGLTLSNSDAVLAASKKTPIRFYGAFASAADLQAMEWIAQNTPPNVLILNHPGPQEGDWVPVISGRDTVYFRRQPFFRGTDSVYARQDALQAFWRHPADPANRVLLARYGIQYVIVPQAITRPDSVATDFRWRPPLPEVQSFGPIPPSVPYLELVANFDGAQVWRVRDYNSGDVDF
ncbi:MAG TPA: hypothetical protein VMT34_04620 [Aggregatilineales bacterium]|nr:hypothetical protein [Aggregatilineales bacterium]